jgi:hypothetical protein
MQSRGAYSIRWNPRAGRCGLLTGGPQQLREADDLQITVRRLEDKIDRLAAESKRGLAQADRAQIRLDS